MKFRNGFVSNSSSMSFCIYGWTQEDLGFDYCEFHTWKELIKDKYPNCKFEDFNFHPTSNGGIIGVGNSAYEFDHYLDLENEIWEEHKEPPPSKKDMELLDSIAEIEKLPKPTLQEATWFG